MYFSIKLVLWEMLQLNYSILLFLVSSSRVKMDSLPRDCQCLLGILCINVLLLSKSGWGERLSHPRCLRVSADIIRKQTDLHGDGLEFLLGSHGDPCGHSRELRRA